MSSKTCYAIDPSTSTLLLVDPQLAFGEVIPVPGVELALDNMRRLSGYWRGHDGRVVLTKHQYDSLEQVGRAADFFGSEIYDLLEAGSPMGKFHPDIYDPACDQVIAKTRYDATFGTDLVNQLGQGSVVLVGLTTPICVGGTARGLMAHNIQVVLAADACASQDVENFTAEEIHTRELAILAYSCVEVLTTRQVLSRASIS